MRNKRNFFLAVISILGLLYATACSSKLACDRIVLNEAIILSFKDSAYKEKYPVGSIEIFIRHKTMKHDSVQVPTIKWINSSNMAHTIMLSNPIDLNTEIKIVVAEKEFLLSNFDIRNHKRELLASSVQECLIHGYMLNGKYYTRTQLRPFIIRTGL